ncbi:MAG: hypothetical protein K0S39_3832 [Paenibacillus sp.]|nr:hypothetical protein [Paenibacillus sp.]
MTAEQTKQIEQLNKMHEKMTSANFHYWQQYSHMGTWQFWFNLAIIVLPLISLFLFIDRRRAILIGFYGFNVHVWFTYIDAFGVTRALWNYPYKAIPLLPVSFALDASFIPIVFMLLYQWILNHRKNYYLYFTGLSLFLSFLFKPALTTFELFQLNKGMNYFYLFLGYMIIMLVSKWITDLFLYLHNEKDDPFIKTFHLSKLFPNKEKAE